MQMILSIVLYQGKRTAIQRELTLGNAIRITTDEGAKEGVVIKITFKVVITQHHIPERTFPIRYLERNYDAAIGDDLRL